MRQACSTTPGEVQWVLHLKREYNIGKMNIWSNIKALEEMKVIIILSLPSYEMLSILPNWRSFNGPWWIISQRWGSVCASARLPNRHMAICVILKEGDKGLNGLLEEQLLFCLSHVRLGKYPCTFQLYLISLPSLCNLALPGLAQLRISMYNFPS